MTNNRFARPIDDLDPQEQELIRPIMAAARTSFGEFDERPDHSDYYCAPGLTPGETWIRVAEELGRVGALAALEGSRDVPLAVDDIELIHRGIFEPVFGAKTLGLRAGRADKVEFPIIVGKPENPTTRRRRGSGVKQLNQNLGRALTGFEQEVSELKAKDAPALADAVRVAVKLYAKLIGFHPFIDGNGRTAWAIASYALQRCGLVEIAIPPSDETRWVLGQALRQDGSQSYEPLTELVVNAIRNSA
ncbi:MAG: Fic family protein [Solirubrobacterales bacterium]